MATSYGTNFRRAEEASNAQGTVQGALDWALANAKKNPTPENIAIAKDTFAARQETINAQPNYAQVLKDAQKDVTDIKSTIDTVNQNITDFNVIGSQMPDFSPVNNVSGGSKSVDQDAFGRLMNQLNQWNLGSLASNITQLLQQGLTYDSVMTKIKYDSTPVDPNNPSGPKWNDAYTTRFAGNKTRLAKGLNALDETSYLNNEDAYAETLKAYGLGNMLSTDRTTNEAKFANYIGNDMAPTEFKNRIDLAVTRVTNMDPAIQKTFMEYYPEVNKTDLISYFLAPDETLPLLKTKVAASEIGSVAGSQGLSIDRNRAEEFAKIGETYAQAQVDYSKVADVLPTGQKLSSIYGEEGIAYNQATAEDEFIKNDAAAKLKRNRLASKERAMFGGDSGLSSQFSSLGKSIQGKY
jgi:hypothetical protein